MGSERALYSFSVFILIFFQLAEGADNIFLAITHEPPFGRKSFDFPYPENPAKVAVILPAPAMVYQGACLYNDTECLQISSKVNFLGSRNNSKVDFRQNQTVFLESVPSELQHENFLCRPGNTVKLNNSQQEPTEDVLCYNAISYFVENENSTSNETVMLVDLEDGDDQVYLGSHPWATLFLMGNSGNKIFHSNQLYNEFRFNSFCNGTLTGEINADFHTVSFITVNGNCSTGKELNVDMTADNGTLIIRKNVNISFSGIKAILLEGLSIKYENLWSARWNLTLVNNLDGWVTVGTKRDSKETAVFCGAEGLGWEEKFMCTQLWQKGMTWIIWLSACLPVGLLVCLIACICVKSKRNSNANKGFETVRKTRNVHLPKKK